MGLYNRNLDRMNINVGQAHIIGQGCNALIFRYHDIILKRYGVYTENFIAAKLFEILARINNPHFIKLYDLFTIIDDKKYDEFKHRCLAGKSKFSASGYTAKYYQASGLNPLEENTAFLLKNIDELRELFDLLATYGISVSDVKLENSIITENGIVIIDPDYYDLIKLSDNPIEREKTISKLKRKNRSELVRYLLTLYRRYYGDETEVLNYFIYLGLESTDPLEEIEKRLRQAEKPSQIIHKRV